MKHFAIWFEMDGVAAVEVIPADDLAQAEALAHELSERLNAEIIGVDDVTGETLTERA
jgi:hypothetical protein